MLQTSSPIRMMGIVLKKEPFPRDPRRIKAMRRIANISAGPNFIAIFARKGASSMRPITLNVPPIQEPQALINRAAPPRPLRVI
jgi:hypothetical protein